MTNDEIIKTVVSPDHALLYPEFLRAMDAAREDEAVGILEWMKEYCNYISVESKELGKTMWVNCKENEVLAHGSDWHFTTLVKEVGITNEQLYQLYLKHKNEKL